MSASLMDLLQIPLRPRILLVGDVMLDRYLWGDVERISPEAPIPILRVRHQEHRLGGAGSVATMLSALDTEPTLCTVVGDDPEGRTIAALLGGQGIDARGLRTDPQRATTLKERLLGQAQQRAPHHMMRVDREDDRPLSPALQTELLAAAEETIAHVDLVLISDYNKGVCAGEMIPRLIELARRAGVRVLADPIKGCDYRRYRGCSCITPNRYEAGLATGRKIGSPADGLEAARQLVSLGIETVLVTLDRDGIAWADAAGRAKHFPCRPRQVCDITGAGDMVLSSLGFALAAGADFPTAIELANTAGGLEVERLGVVPLSRGEIAAELDRHAAGGEGKIVARGRLPAVLDAHRRAGRRIVMTNGCFDLLHPGHVAVLQAARALGDALVVGLNSDRSVRALKGPERPVIPQHDRAAMLAALSCVDCVVLFDETSVAPLVAEVRPDVLVKAAQYRTDQVVGHEIVESYGGQVVTVPMKADYSTSSLVERLRSEPRRHAA